MLLLLGLVIGVAAVAVVASGLGSRVLDGPTASSAQGAGASASVKAGAAVAWPAPPDPLERTVAAGLEPGPSEGRANHVHAHLDVFVDGKPIAVPAGIGININDPEVIRFDDPGGVSYGGIKVCGQPCISPLHTHAGTGIIHTESDTQVSNTLGQFFTEWGVDLSESCVGTYCSPQPIAIYLNGQRYAGDPRAIELTDRRQIAIVIGTPPAQIPSTADFSQD